MNREAIYSELFRRITSAGPGGEALYKTTGRVLVHWNDVQPEMQPALFQAQAGEDCARTRGLPPKWTLRVTLYVYVATDAETPPSTVLNPLLDALEDALAPDDADGATCTLGGLVSHCYIAGTIETFEGTLGSQEVAIVPVEILVPSLR